MYVVGATKASLLVKIREIIPDHFLLIPGIGAQGGDLAEVARYGLNKNCGLIVNSSRAIIYADSTERFAEVAAVKAREVQVQMEGLSLTGFKDYRINIRRKNRINLILGIVQFFCILTPLF